MGTDAPCRALRSERHAQLAKVVLEQIPDLTAKFFFFFCDRTAAGRLLGVQRRYTCQEIAQAVGGARVGIKATSELQRYKVCLFFQTVVFTENTVRTRQL